MVDFRQATGTASAQLLLRVEITQNAALNQSTYHSQLYLENVPSATFIGSAGCRITINGAANNHTYSWASGGGTRLIFDIFNTYTHDADGYLTIPVSAHIDATGTGGIGGPTDIGTQNVAAPRISKAPKAPSTPVLTSSNPTQISVDWNAPADDGGSAITGYRVQVDDNSGFTSPATYSTGTTTAYTATGQTPGKKYWVRVAAVNAVGVGSYSAASTITIGIGGKRWDGSAEKAFTVAMRWDGTKEVPITVAKRWNGTAEVDIT